MDVDMEDEFPNAKSIISGKGKGKENVASSDNLPWYVGRVQGMYYL
jgi:hypothetical protein